MKIIKAEQAHITPVANLFDAYRVWYKKPSDLAGAIEFLTQRIESGESTVYACETDDGELVGFTQLYPLFSSTRMKRLWLLNDLFVKKEFRGKGISKLLIDAAKQLARTTDACGLLLETQKNNEIGNKLYPHVGFEIEDDTNFYFWTTD